MPDEPLSVDERLVIASKIDARDQEIERLRGVNAGLTEQRLSLSVQVADLRTEIRQLQARLAEIEDAAISEPLYRYHRHAEVCCQAVVTREGQPNQLCGKLVWQRVTCIGLLEDCDILSRIRCADHRQTPAPTPGPSGDPSIR